MFWNKTATSNELTLEVDVDALKNLPRLPSFVGATNQYFPESREDVLIDICTWIEGSSEPLLWLHGAAGLGKSTLMHELVNHLRSAGRLATFAFLTLGSSGDAAQMICMMSRELGAMHPDAIPYCTSHTDL